MSTTPGQCIKEGDPPAGCCVSDANCLGDLVCAPAAPGSSTLELGSCEAPLDEGQCWSDADCGIGTGCKGVATCGCNSFCAMPSSPGVCEPIVVPPDGCCLMDQDCSDEQVCAEVASGPANGSACVPAPSAGKCWNDEDCDEGQGCVGEFICPCGALCGAGPFQGTCTATENECLKDADCSGSAAFCIAGPTCTDLCVAGDPACCEGNTCSLCPASLPQGCSVDGNRPEGQKCLMNGGCNSSTCGCDPKDGSILCTADCQPGACGF